METMISLIWGGRDLSRRGPLGVSKGQGHLKACRCKTTEVFGGFGPSVQTMRFISSLVSVKVPTMLLSDLVHIIQPSSGLLYVSALGQGMYHMEDSENRGS